MKCFVFFLFLTDPRAPSAQLLATSTQRRFPVLTMGVV
jgi:hypothetical protein